LPPSVPVEPTVLIVDDEPDVADAQALKIRAKYDTRVAYGGQEALDAMDHDVDAVLLDRRMPGVHGDEVLERIRERGYECKIILTTAVDPDLNILEMEFDDYLCKPIHKETLLETLEQQIEPARTTDPRLDEFFQVVSKIEVLKEELSARELNQSEEYAQLKTKAKELGQELDESMSDFEEIVQTFRDINRGAA
jgi:DNA-binding response OmpR family regulator